VRPTPYTLLPFLSSLDISGQILHLASEHAFPAFKSCLHYKDCVVPVDTLVFLLGFEMIDDHECMQLLGG
jgi:hypothetical protein